MANAYVTSTILFHTQHAALSPTDLTVLKQRLNRFVQQNKWGDPQHATTIRARLPYEFAIAPARMGGINFTDIGSAITAWRARFLFNAISDGHSFPVPLDHIVPEARRASPSWHATALDILTTPPDISLFFPPRPLWDPHTHHSFRCLHLLSLLGPWPKRLLHLIPNPWRGDITATHSFQYALPDPVALHACAYDYLLSWPLFLHPLLSPANRLIKTKKDVVLWSPWARARVLTLGDIWDTTLHDFVNPLTLLPDGVTAQPQCLYQRVYDKTHHTRRAQNAIVVDFFRLCDTVPRVLIEALRTHPGRDPAVRQLACARALLPHGIDLFPSPGSFLRVTNTTSFRGDTTTCSTPIGTYSIQFGYAALLGPCMLPPSAEYRPLVVGEPQSHRSWSAIVANSPLAPWIPGPGQGPLQPLPVVPLVGPQDPVLAPLPSSFWTKLALFHSDISHPLHQQLAREIHCRTVPVGSHFRALPLVGHAPSPATSPLCPLCTLCGHPARISATLEHTFLDCPLLTSVLHWEDQLWVALGHSPATRISAFQRLLGLDPRCLHSTISDSPFWPHFYAAIRAAIWSTSCAARHGRLRLPRGLHADSPPPLLRAYVRRRVLLHAQCNVKQVLRYIIHDFRSTHHLLAPTIPFAEALTHLRDSWPGIHHLVQQNPQHPSLFSFSLYIFD